MITDGYQELEWIFEFRTYHYHYAYHPDTVVFAKQIGNLPGGKGVFSWKLLIDEEAVYDVRLVR